MGQRDFSMKKDLARVGREALGVVGLPDLLTVTS